MVHSVANFRSADFFDAGRIIDTTRNEDPIAGFGKLCRESRNEHFFGSFSSSGRIILTISTIGFLSATMELDTRDTIVRD